MSPPVNASFGTRKNPAVSLCAMCAIKSASGVVAGTTVPTHCTVSNAFAIFGPSTPVSSAISTFAPDVPREASNTGITIIPIMKTGPRTVMATNHLVRTRSRNSRFAITNASRMVHHSVVGPALRDHGSVAPDALDEDLMQRRYDDLEPADRDVGREQLREQLLRRD